MSYLTCSSPKNRLNYYWPADFWDEVFRTSSSTESGARYDRDDNNYYVQLDLPGVTKETLKLKVEDDQLFINATRKVGVGKNVKEEKVTKTYFLNEEIDPDKIEAEIKEGVLTLTLPKKEEKKPKSIEINIK